MEKVFNLVILDASGSMDIIRKSAHQGLNDTIKQLKSLQQELPDRQQLLTLLLFNSDQTEFLYENTPIQDAGKLPLAAYKPDGATPLYDAIGRGIHAVQKACGTIDAVVVTIITDGEENCSKEYNHAKIKTRIERCKQKGWDFTFIGTEGIDVQHISNSIGITQHIVFEQSALGTSSMFERRCQEVADYNRRLSKR